MSRLRWLRQLGEETTLFEAAGDAHTAEAFRKLAEVCPARSYEGGLHSNAIAIVKDARSSHIGTTVRRVLPIVLRVTVLND